MNQKMNQKMNHHKKNRDRVVCYLGFLLGSVMVTTSRMVEIKIQKHIRKNILKIRLIKLMIIKRLKVR